MNSGFNHTVVRTVLSNAPPVWLSNDLVANNKGNTGWLGTIESTVSGGLAAAAGGVVAASALFRPKNAS